MTSKSPAAKPSQPTPVTDPLSSIKIAPRFDPVAILKSLGAEGRWSKSARLCAEIGVGNPSHPRATPEQATALLADLLPYPQHSSARKPRDDANKNWWAHALLLSSQVVGKDGSPVELASPSGVASPYPPVFVSERIAALGRLGADPAKARALMRAAFRKSSEEIEAVLALPGCPTPGSVSGRGGSALHRASYQGPNPIFAQLARAASPSDWLSEDDQGRLPIELACQNGNMGRSLAIARLTPWERDAANERGDSPLHRLARAIGHHGGRDDDYAAWTGLFEELAGKLGPDCFFAPNKLGQSPVDLAPMPGLRDAIRRAQSKASLAVIGEVASPAPTPAPVRAKSRL